MARTANTPNTPAPEMSKQERATLAHKEIVTIGDETAKALEPKVTDLAARRRAIFDVTVSGLRKQGQVICEGLATLVDMNPANVSGSTIHKLAKGTPTSPVYCHDDDDRKAMPSEAHFSRAADVFQLDPTGERFNDYCDLGTMPFDKERFILWAAVLAGRKAEGDLLDCGKEKGSFITRDDDGKVTGAFVKGSAAVGTRRKEKEDTAKKEQDAAIAAAVAAAIGATGSATGSVAAPIHPMFAILADPAKVDAIVADGATRLAGINPANLESLALLLAAAVIVRDRVAVDSDLAALTA